jgi:phospholipid/cholesterol/gamma-HCH transport system substrate-binding protein
MGAMSSNKRNLMVGVVVLGGIGVLAWMVLKFANQAATFFLTKGTHITVISDRADGVSEGSAIYYRGVNVGRVLDLNLAGDQTVRIQAIIDEGRPVPANVEGVIRTGNLLSASASIFLEPVHDVAAVVDSAATAPTSRPERLLREGDVLKATMPSGNALLPKEFNESLREFQDRKLIQHVDEAIATIREQAVKAGQLMDSIREVTGDEKVHTDLRTAIANVREATEQANQIGENLKKFSADLNGMSKDAQATITDIKATVGDTRQVIGKANEQLTVTSRNVNDRIDQIGKVLGQFQAIATKVQRGDGTAGKLVADARLYDSMADTAAELKEMVRDLRRLVQQWEQEGLSLKMK